MTLVFRSISCRLGGEVSPPSHSSSSWEEDVTQEEEEGEEYEDPISTPFLSPGLSSDNGRGQLPIVAFVMGALKKSLLVSCSTSTSVSVVEEEIEIGCPTDVTHVSHVTFDRFNGFLGLPLEFQPQLPPKVPSASASVFGVSPLSMQCSIDQRGNSVPTILIMMQNRLYRRGALQAEGIFRINPDNTQELFLRTQLNKGVVPQGIDVHCLAGLIKAWFRELPKGVLDSLTAEQVMHCNTEHHCTQLVKLLPPTELALLDWAINLMADVVQNEHHNKMNARNIAMVFAPNMTQMADPLTALIHAVQVMNFLKTLIVRTLRLREESAVEDRMLSSYADSLNANANSNSHSSISIGDMIFEKHHNRVEQAHNIELYRRLEFSPKHKHQNHKKDNEQGKDYGCFSGDNSPVTSLASESKHQSREVEGILDRLNFRKGVKKLCRHPVFQLNKPAKKIAELESCK